MRILKIDLKMQVKASQTRNSIYNRRKKSQVNNKIYFC